MKKLIAFLPLIAASSVGYATVVSPYGLGNFDAVNDTGQPAYGLEFELDDAKSSQFIGSYTYNHYGVPKIREDSTDPLHPKLFVRWEAPAHPDAFYTGVTLPATASPTQLTSGESCAAPRVGCEHFGIRLNAQTYTAVKYSWLVKDASGNVVTGPQLKFNTPTYTYKPPVIQQPAVVVPNPIVNQPPIVQVPAVVAFGGNANVVANLPAPIVANKLVANKEFGEPSWVKVIKTSTHKANPQLVLEDLVSDKDANGNPKWANGEPTEVESEWYLLQTDNGNANNAKASLAGSPDDMGDGSEIVTRRYEFYAYAAPVDSVDDETGEAMCDAVAADGKHGIGTVGVTKYDPANPGETMSIQFDCSTVQVVGNYQGAQMNAFDANAAFTTAGELQDGKVGAAYPERALLHGGVPSYTAPVPPVLPDGLSLDTKTGILKGTPAKVGVFTFNVSASDSFGSKVSKDFTLNVTGRGDVNSDYEIDTLDLALIQSRYGQAAKANDPADMNGDLKINGLDYRKAASLCTKARCAH